MPIILAPGVHPPDLTEGFCRDFQATWPVALPRPLLWVVPPTVPPFSPCHHWRWLQEQIQHGTVLDGPHPPAPLRSTQASASPILGEGELDLSQSLRPLPQGRGVGVRGSVGTLPLVWIAFSAGVVGALGAAQGWQWRGGRVRGFYALDGWGMPLGGKFPMYRLSHDRFTHRTSLPLGAGRWNFYADPSVEHWDLWRSPAQVWGWSIDRSCPAASPQRQTAAQFLVQRLVQRLVQPIGLGITDPQA